MLWTGVYSELLHETGGRKVHVDGVIGFYFFFFLTHTPQRKSRMLCKAVVFKCGPQTGGLRVPATWELVRNINPQLHHRPPESETRVGVPQSTF